MIAEPIGFKHEQREKKVSVKKLQKASQLRCFFMFRLLFRFFESKCDLLHQNMQKVLIKTGGIGIIISNKKTRILSKRNRCFVNGIAHQICAVELAIILGGGYHHGERKSNVRIETENSRSRLGSYQMLIKWGHLWCTEITNLK